MNGVSHTANLCRSVPRQAQGGRRLHSRRRGDRLPAAVDQALHRLEADLVGHLAALGDPVAEVQVGQFERAAEVDLPQDVVGAVARADHLGVEERVDGRQAVLQFVDDAHHAQHAVVAEFDQPRVDVALQQEVAVLLAAVLVHAAASVARGLVAQVEIVVFGAVLEIERGGGEAGMALAGAALRAARLVLFHRYPYRHASPAGITVGAIGERAAAPEAGLDQFAVDRAVDQMAGGGDL